jgi:hypothetical protein
MIQQMYRQLYGLVYNVKINSRSNRYLNNVLLKAYYTFLKNENQDYNEENFKPKQRFYYSKLTWYKRVFVNNSVFNLHFMKVSTEIDNNFGYEKIAQLVDNIPLIPILLFE